MTHGLPEHLQPVVETICNAGCEHVYKTIDILADDGDTDETGPLSGAERKQVLLELKHIMSVYQQK